MKILGCTTPFGQKFDHICKDRSKTHPAFWLFENITSGRKFSMGDYCKNPCESMRIRFLSGTVRGDAFRWNYIVLNFDKYIKVTKARYAYTELELFAEFGGYVGLFLGVSIYQISEGIPVFMDVVSSKFSYLKITN